MEPIELTPDAVGPVARGHPWVWRDGVARGFAPVGSPVRLVDGRGRPVAWGLADRGEIAVRVLGRDPESVPDLLTRRLAEAQALRDRVLPPATDAFRVCNGEGDHLPGLVVDRYGALAVVRLYAAAWEPHLDAVVSAVAALGGIEAVLRRLGVGTVDADGGAVPLHGPPPPDAIVVHEAGLRFLVRPWRGQKTGLFLDQRENRIRMAGWARGAEVVNLFGYNGGFSVHAAAGGARRTVTVDVASEALSDARENFRLNGLDDAGHGFEVADAFRWRPPRPVDLVICDPPSLSHGARSDGPARAAYRDLAAHAAAMTAPGGLLFTASCTARIREDRWMEAVRKGIGRVPGRWSVVHRAFEPPDHPVSVAHPEGAYLKAVALRRR
ncbi:MAG: class I SAM-dependent rRNA methyltransferase [Deltaproteobacteria bacterium]|nr:class I SAM-dependent rRNA methyltransferase [Deltaproteobacteria bacterium]